MTEAIRFHLDENVNPAVAVGLRRRNIDVTTSQEAGLLGKSDEEQLDYARRTGRVIFTQDTDFLILTSSTNNHSGIVYAKKGTRSIGQVIDALELIHGVMSIAELEGHIEFL